MTAESVFDPSQRELHRAKLAMRRYLLEALYAPFQERFAKGVAQLVIRNTEIGKFSHSGFSFEGQRYGDPWIPRARIPMPALIPELRPAMDELVREQRFIEQTERPYIALALSALLTRSMSVREFRDHLPEALYRTVAEAPSQCLWNSEHSRPSVPSQASAIIDEGLQMLRERLVKNLIDL